MADLITRKYLPAGIDKAPETVVEALTAARSLLAEENRWRKKEWFKNEHPELDENDPFCNSWAVCAEGAVALVVVGTFNGKQLWEEFEVTTEGGEWEDSLDEDYDGYVEEVYHPEPWCVNSDLIRSYANPAEGQLYDESVEALRQTANRLVNELGGEYETRRLDDAWTYNDDFITTAQEVLDWFDAAIADAS